MSLLLLLACFQSWTVTDATDATDACQERVVFEDADGDGHGGAERFSGCAEDIPFADYADSNTDCDDSDPSVYPGAPELCDGQDQNCDGAVDNDPTDPGTWYTDLDGDGYGDSADEQLLCDQPSGTSEQGGDCDDQDSTQYPGAPEICGDGVPNDCAQGAPEQCRLLGSLALNQADASLEGLRGMGWILVSAELNGDSLPDLAAGSLRAEAVLVAGQGKPVESVLYSTVSNASFGAALTTGDMNGDGEADLVVGAPGTGLSYLFTGPIVSGTVLDYESQGILRHATADPDAMTLYAPGDLDQDSAPELLVGFPGIGKSFSARVELHSGFWDGAYNAQVADLYGQTGETLGQSITHADLDGDGVPQAVIGSQLGLYALAPWISGGLFIEDAASATLSSADRVFAEMSPAGDLLGDGHEGVWVSDPNSEEVGYWRGDAKTFKDLPIRLLYKNMSGQISGGQDLDQDGHSDLLVGYTGQLSAQVTLSYGPFEEGVTEADLSFEGLSLNISDLLLTPDMNGDGASEVAVGQQEDDAVYLFFGSSI